MTSTAYLVQVEQLDMHTGKRTRYYVKRVDDCRQAATFTLDAARHVAANMGNDFRYRRHATVVAFTEEVV